MSVAFARLSADPLELDDHLAAVSRPDFGALATFVGVVRDHDPDVSGEVTALEYSAHPDAERVLGEIAARFADTSGAVRVAVTHRVGRIEVGGYAIIAVVASAHRAEAFDACRALVEAVKAEVPIWKRQLLADGTHTWVGLRAGA